MASLIETHMLRPFVWGEADCCRSVCAVLEARGLGAPGAAFWGRYDSERAAERLTGGDLEAVVARECARLGWPPVPPESAADGDIGLVGPCLALREAGWWLVKSPEGVLYKRRARRVWRPA